MKRFVSEDPMGLAAGLNSYENPTNYSDPNGLCSIIGRSFSQLNPGKQAAKQVIDQVCREKNKADECKACDCIYDFKVLTCGPGNYNCVERLKLRDVGCKIECSETGHANFPPPNGTDPPDPPDPPLDKKG